MAATAPIRAGKAFVEIYADNSKLGQGLAQAEHMLKEMSTKFTVVGKNLVRGGAYMSAPVALSAKVFASFDDNIRKAGALSNATSKELQNLDEKARELGRNTSFTAIQVSDAMATMAQAGFKATEIYKSISSMLNLSRATMTDLTLSTETAMAAIRAFNLSIEDSGRVADVLAKACATSATSLENMNDALRYVATTSNAAGYSLEETVGIIGQLANVGIKGTMAGTTLKNIISRLANADIRNKFKGLGIDVTDEFGGLRNVGDILAELGKAMEDLPPAERVTLLRDLFDLRAMPGTGALSKLDVGVITDYINSLKNAAGEAARISTEMDAGVGGSIRITLSALESTGLEFVKTFQSELINTLDGFKNALDTITKLVKDNKFIVREFVNLGKYIIYCGGAIWGVGKALKGLSIGAVILRTISNRFAAINNQARGKLFQKLYGTNASEKFKELEDIIDARRKDVNKYDKLTIRAKESLQKAQFEFETLGKKNRRGKRYMAAQKAVTDATEQLQDASILRDMSMDRLAYAEKAAENFKKTIPTTSAMAKTAIKQLTQEMKTSVFWTNLMGKSVRLLKAPFTMLFGFIKANPFFAAITGITLLIEGIRKLRDTTVTEKTEAHDALNSFNESITSVTEKLNKLRELQDAFTSGNADINTDQYLKLTNTIDDLNRKFGLSIKYSKDLNNMWISGVPGNEEFMNSDMVKFQAMNANSGALNESIDNFVNYLNQIGSQEAAFGTRNGIYSMTLNNGINNDNLLGVEQSRMMDNFIANNLDDLMEVAEHTGRTDLKRMLSRYSNRQSGFGNAVFGTAFRDNDETALPEFNRNIADAIGIGSSILSEFAARKQISNGAGTPESENTFLENLTKKLNERTQALNELTTNIDEFKGKADEAAKSEIEKSLSWVSEYNEMMDALQLQLEGNAKAYRALDEQRANGAIDEQSFRENEKRIFESNKKITDSINTLNESKKILTNKVIGDKVQSIQDDISDAEQSTGEYARSVRDAVKTRDKLLERANEVIKAAEITGEKITVGNEQLDVKTYQERVQKDIDEMFQHDLEVAYKAFQQQIQEEKDNFRSSVGMTGLSTRSEIQDMQKSGEEYIKGLEEHLKELEPNSDEYNELDSLIQSEKQYINTVVKDRVDQLKETLEGEVSELMNSIQESIAKNKFSDQFSQRLFEAQMEVFNAKQYGTDEDIYNAENNLKGLQQDEAYGKIDYYTNKMKNDQKRLQQAEDRAAKAEKEVNAIRNNPNAGDAEVDAFLQEHKKRLEEVSALRDEIQNDRDQIIQANDTITKLGEQGFEDADNMMNNLESERKRVMSSRGTFSAYEGSSLTMSNHDRIMEDYSKRSLDYLRDIYYNTNNLNSDRVASFA